jgi:thymidylate synthase (FAD)
MTVEFINNTTATLVNYSASDEMVAMAAWVSNDADSEEKLNDEGRVEKLINFLYSNRHMSPFEHGVFTWKIDCPLFVRSEFHRHRTWSYNEVSGRYTEMKPRIFRGDRARVQKGKMGNYYFVDGGDDLTAQYHQSKLRVAELVWEEYLYRLELGLSKEQAREDLPLSLMTQFYATANPRNVMQFLALRTDSHALKEIRELANQMEEQFATVMPLTHKAYAKAREKELYPEYNITINQPGNEEQIAKYVLDAINASNRKKPTTKR